MDPDDTIITFSCTAKRASRFAAWDRPKAVEKVATELHLEECQIMYATIEHSSANV